MAVLVVAMIVISNGNCDSCGGGDGGSVDNDGCGTCGGNSEKHFNKKLQTMFNRNLCMGTTVL